MGFGKDGWQGHTLFKDGKAVAVLRAEDLHVETSVGGGSISYSESRIVALGEPPHQKKEE